MAIQVADIEQLKHKIDLVKTEFGKVIVGQEEIIERLIVSVLSGGHCLLVGYPGLAKTLIVKTLAEILGLDFKRIQFTPDLMPTDITGTEILEVDPEGKRYFKFIKGPLFANILLADEINRTPPKTQAALLEAMQEKTVTVAGEMFKLDAPFFVLATQNPIEQEGTYPLPEAQMDRFLFFLTLDYPSYEDEISIVNGTMKPTHISPIENVYSKTELLSHQKLIRELTVEQNVIEFAVSIVQATRSNAEKPYSKYIRYGAGPRASQNLIIAAKALAAIRGDLLVDRNHVIELADSVLEHRIMLSYTGEAEGWTKKKLIATVINEYK